MAKNHRVPWLDVSRLSFAADLQRLLKDKTYANLRPLTLANEKCPHITAAPEVIPSGALTSALVAKTRNIYCFFIPIAVYKITEMYYNYLVKRENRLSFYPTSFLQRRELLC